MKPYSIDLRERVLAACDAGAGTRAAARQFVVSEAWVRRLEQRRRELGLVGALPPDSGGRGPALDAAADDRLRAPVAATPDATPAELRGSLGGRPVGVGALWNALRRLGLPRKKSPAGRPSRTGPTSGSGGTGGRPRWARSRPNPWPS